MISAHKKYIFVLSLFLLVLGVGGFIQQPILGIFGVNIYQNILHIVAGLIGLGFSFKLPAVFIKWFGWLSLAFGVVGFIPFTDVLLRRAFGANISISWLHIALGIVSILVGYSAMEKPNHEQ